MYIFVSILKLFGSIAVKTLSILSALASASNIPVTRPMVFDRAMGLYKLKYSRLSVPEGNLRGTGECRL
jgi:hypothetical protein